MDISTAAKYMKHGYRVRSPSDSDILYMYYQDNLIWGKSKLLGTLPLNLVLEDLLVDDWELILEGIVDDYGNVKYENDKL